MTNSSLITTTKPAPAPAITELPPDSAEGRLPCAAVVQAVAPKEILSLITSFFNHGDRHGIAGNPSNPDAVLVPRRDNMILTVAKFPLEDFAKRIKIKNLSPMAEVLVGVSGYQIDIRPIEVSKVERGAAYTWCFTLDGNTLGFQESAIRSGRITTSPFQAGADDTPRFMAQAQSFSWEALHPKEDGA